MFKRSWARIPALLLDGHFFTLICFENCIFCLKGPKINEKEAGVCPFFKKSFRIGRGLAKSEKKQIKKIF